MVGPYDMGKQKKFTKRDELVINTCFEVAKRRRYTWSSPTDIKISIRFYIIEAML